MNDDQARDLHDAIERREAAWRNFDSAVKMPRDAANSGRVSTSGAAEAWIAADAGVRQIMANAPLMIDGSEYTTVRQTLPGPMEVPRDPGKPEGKRRGRPPKVRTEGDAVAGAVLPRDAAGDAATP